MSQRTTRAGPQAARNALPTGLTTDSRNTKLATVHLQQLTKIFPGNIRAVDDLSLEVASGELLVVVGPSGCGKTTTLRLIAGLESPTSGKVQIGDRDVTSLAPAKRNVAMAFQDHALYPHLNVYDNLAFGLRMRGEKPAAFDSDVRQIAELLQIDSLVERHVHELSEGQRQRVALGRALVRKPACFLLDEPLASLDETLRGQLRKEIRRLHRELDTTMIFVTHDQHEAMMLGDRIAVLNDGQLQQCGTPAEVYERPINRHVATLIGTPTMNLLPGRLQADGQQLQFDAGGWQLALPGNLAIEVSNDAPTDVLLGIRPQAIEPGTENGQASIPARIDGVQPLGDATELRLTLPGEQAVVARVRPDAPSQLAAAQVGSSCHVGFLPTGLHLFSNDERGQNLLADSGCQPTPPSSSQ